MSSEPKQLPPLSERVGKRFAIRPIYARYDAAQTTDDNRRHWNATDGYSPDAATSPEVRRIIRNRSRYEYANGSHCKGIVETLANDCVGIGPELQLMIKDKGLKEAIETDFWDWSTEIGLAEILWQLRASRAHSGEGIGIIGTNPALLSDVKLDIRLIEPEQLCEPFLPSRTPDQTDGIEYDQYGNARTYNVLKHHPGGTATFGLYQPTDFDPIPARYVLHYTKADRPGQRRGVPDITPALPLFAELRRYTAAVIAAAETAADYAMAIQSDAPADDGLDENGNPISDGVTAMDTIELEKRMATVLPKGFKLTQTKAEQPVTGYAEFVDAKIAEIARCLNMPFSIASLSSAKANMSAAYLDGQRYGYAVLIDRNRLERLINRLFDEWLTEWVRIRRPSNLPNRFPRAWRWPSLNHHADPAKVANAQATRIANGTSSIPLEATREGGDWEAIQESAAQSLGITVQEYRKLLTQKIFSNGNPPMEAAAKEDDQ